MIGRLTSRLRRQGTTITHESEGIRKLQANKLSTENVEPHNDVPKSDTDMELCLVCRMCNQKIPLDQVELHSKQCYMKSVDEVKQRQANNGSQPTRSRKVTIESFVPVSRISKGAFGTVFKVRKKDTNDIFALKVMQKARLIRKNQVDRVKGERDVIPRMSATADGEHFIVRFFWTFQNAEYVFLVMEYLPIDLKNMLTMVGGLDETVVKQYMAELIIALEYCHRNSIVHRDIKPDNILIDNNGHLRLIDFGLSSTGLKKRHDLEYTASPGDISPEAMTFSMVGTPEYLAPEILTGEGHSYPVDWWALGVLMFEMLFGLPPFTAPERDAIFAKIVNDPLEFPMGAELDASPEAMDLMTALLVKDPAKRLGTRGDGAEIRRHPWLKDVAWGELYSTSMGLVLPQSPTQDGDLGTGRAFDEQEWLGFLRTHTGISSVSLKASAIDQPTSLEDGHSLPGVDPFLNFQFSFTDYKGLYQLTIEEARALSEAQEIEEEDGPIFGLEIESRERIRSPLR